MEWGLKRMISGIHKEDQHGCLYHSTKYQSDLIGRHMRSRDRRLQLAKAQVYAPNVLRQYELIFGSVLLKCGGFGGSWTHMLGTYRFDIALYYGVGMFGHATAVAQ